MEIIYAKDKDWLKKWDAFAIHFITKKILIEAKNKAVFIVVNQDNLSSIKRIEKAGFKKCATIKAKRGLCFYFDKNIKYC